jgi:hypothetical protein
VHIRESSEIQAGLLDIDEVVDEPTRSQLFALLCLKAHASQIRSSGMEEQPRSMDERLPSAE